MHMIFTPDGSGTDRGTGYATVEYSSDSEDETVIETTDEDVTAVFKDAKQRGETLDGRDQPIDAAVDDPLDFRDFLILVEGEIEFDSDYTRPSPDQQ